MKLEVKDLIGKHKNKPGLVIGHSPVLNFYSNYLDTWKNENKFVQFETNEWYDFRNEPPNYWVLANNQLTTDKIVNILLQKQKLETILCYAYSADHTDISNINFPVDYLPYDERHYYGKECGSGICCNYRKEGVLTLSQEIQKLTKYKDIYPRGVGTSIVHAVAFAILTGCNPIYIVGVNLDYKLGYAKNTGNILAPPNSDMNDYLSPTLKAFEVLRNSAKKIGINIFVAIPNPDFGIFEKRNLL